MCVNIKYILVLAIISMESREDDWDDVIKTEPKDMEEDDWSETISTTISKDKIHDKLLMVMNSILSVVFTKPQLNELVRKMRSGEINEKCIYYMHKMATKRKEEYAKWLSQTIVDNIKFHYMPI